jgi:hypothetical protein
VFRMKQSPHCNEHYACACYTNEITRLGVRLTKVEAELRKLRRIAYPSPSAQDPKQKGNNKESY